MAEQAILYENQVSVSGQLLRHALDSPLGEGVFNHTHLKVTAGTGIAVDVAAGVCWVRGDAISDQGLYRCRNDASKSSVDFETGGIPAAHSTNPRLDQIIARVYDDDADNLDLRKWRLEVLPGSATAGATLDNRNGADALPESALLLADVLVPAGASDLSDSDIRYRAQVATEAAPSLFGSTIGAMVGMSPLAPNAASIQTLSHTDHDDRRAAVAMVLRRRIQGANRIRFKYAQGATAIAGSYVVAIFDSSARLITDSGSIAFAGGANSFQREILTIPATDFEGGVYYVMFGMNSTAGACAYMGVPTDVDSADNSIGAPVHNLAFASATAGLTVPTSLVNFTDVGDATVQTLRPPVPLIALSVN